MLKDAVNIICTCDLDVLVVVLVMWLFPTVPLFPGLLVHPRFKACYHVAQSSSFCAYVKCDKSVLTETSVMEGASCWKLCKCV
jgi:hypothetical protein